MASGIYAVAHIGHLKIYVCEATKLHTNWPPLMAKLNKGIHPNAVLQQVWNQEEGKRYFTFHTQKDLEGAQEIAGLEELVD